MICENIKCILFNWDLWILLGKVLKYKIKCDKEKVEDLSRLSDKWLI